MAAANISSEVFENASSSISKRTFCVAGILTTVYGLDELLPAVSEVCCLWLLHPRLETQAYMESLAVSSIMSWNQLLEKGDKSEISVPLGLIAISFDQRNHGTRQVSALANEAWRSGNPTHAQDLFSIYSKWQILGLQYYESEFSLFP